MAARRTRWCTISSTASKGVEYATNSVCAPNRGNSGNFHAKKMIKSIPRKKGENEAIELSNTSSPTSVFFPFFHAETVPAKIPKST